MKILNQILTGGLLLVVSTAFAANVILPNSFTANTPAKAAEVNGNFTAVKTAVDDNNNRIITLEGVSADLRLDALETNASNPNIIGNIMLVPSTVTSGNILKGSMPFLHDYGFRNIFLGLDAGNFYMTGAHNIGSGFQSLVHNTGGSYNIASGTFSLAMNTSGNNNIAIGGMALFINTTGTDNTAIGYRALYTNTSANDNTAIGALSLTSNTTGTGNVANGYGALQSNSIGSNNTAVGYQGLQSNTTGNANSGVGYQALQFNQTGFNNSAYGLYALRSNTTGTRNTGIGTSSLYYNTTGSSNTALGEGSGFNLTTGDYNIDIGNSGVAGEAYTTRIGYSQTRTFIAGINTGVTGNAVYVTTNGQLGILSSSRRVKDNIADMDAASNVLLKLRPVTFYYITDQNPKARALQYGLIAEEVAKIAPSLVAYKENGDVETVYYHKLIPMLLNEYQKQQRTIAAQQALLSKQTAHIAALEKQVLDVADLKRQLTTITAVVTQLQRSAHITTAQLNDK